MELTPDFWTPMKHWAAFWISIRNHLPWGVVFLFPYPSQTKLFSLSSHKLRPVVGKTGNLSIPSSSSECWKGIRVVVSGVLGWVAVQSSYKHLALLPIFFLLFSFLSLFFLFLLSLSPPVPTGSSASNRWEAKSENLSAAPYLTAAVKTTEVE